MEQKTLDERAGLPPLLKWPGGKRRLLRSIESILPASYGRYYEPFFGGGALFFSLRPNLASLADRNEDLIDTYIEVRDNPYKVIEHLSTMKNSKRNFYDIRDSKRRASAYRAARIIYLTTLSFNGIHRVNMKGEFNVPYGGKTHLDPCDAPRLISISNALKHTTLRCCDFEVAVARARSNDLIYLDPPYTVAHGNNGFVKYNAKIFSWDDQTRLARVAFSLRDKGCHVIVSNADHPSIRELYDGFHVSTIDRYSVMSASAEFRKRITECIFSSGEPK